MSSTPIDFMWHHGHCDVCGTRCVMVAHFGYNKLVRLQGGKFSNNIVGLLEDANKRPPRPYKICEICLLETLIASRYCPMKLELPLGKIKIDDHTDLSRVHLGFRDRKEDGTVLWAICDGPFCLSTDIQWEYERSPSNRPEEFLARTRFTLREALDVLEKFGTAKKEVYVGDEKLEEKE